MRQIRNLKFRIYGFEVRCAALISQGLVSGKGRKPILERLKRELDGFRRTVRLSNSEANGLWLMCLSTYNNVAKTVWGKRTDNTSVYRAIKRNLPRLERVKNEIGRNIEERDKVAYLGDLLSEGIFYLCSSHKNCAKGHEPFQGKIYVCEDWKNRCRDSTEKKRIRAYIRNHGCMTVEEICGEPVYMVTRPNCRHYFIRLPTEEVLGASVNKLLKSHNLVSSEPNSYEYSLYRMYYERLKMLKALRRICPCSDLENDITKTYGLTKKWLSMVSR